MYKKLLLVFVPVLLWAWGNDYYIRSIPYMAQSYDILIQSTDNDYHLLRYCEGDTLIQFLRGSSDSGKTWDIYFSGFGRTNYCKNEDVSLFSMQDSIVVYFPLDGLKTFTFIIRDTNIYYPNERTFTINNVDTIINTKFRVIYNSGDWEFYLGGIARNGDTSLLITWRSTDHGSTWEEIIHRAYTTVTDIHTFLLDFDVYRESPDSILIVPTVSYKNQSSENYAVYAEFYRYNLSTNHATLIAPFTPLKITGSYHEATCSIRNDLVAWAIVDTGILYFVWTKDKGANYNSMEYPYQSSFDYISGVDMVPWTLFSGGFNLAFIGTSGGITNVWYHELFDTGDSINFSTDGPQQVSDSGVYTFLLNSSPYYHPKIRNMNEIANPYITWHVDFSHFGGVPPTFQYDSARFYIDWMTNPTGVKENKQPVTAMLQIKNRNNILELSSDYIHGSTDVQIMDITGRCLIKKRFNGAYKSLNIDIADLKGGVYFVSLKAQNRLLQGKFIKVR